MGEQLRGLTALRGWAALWVALHHAILSLNGAKALQGTVWADVADKGWLGVDLFFILSGFIIAHSNGKSLSRWSMPVVKKFLFKRFARIFPAHLFVMALCGLVVAAATASGAFMDPQGIYTWDSFMGQLFLLNGLGLGEPRGWNVPTWSIGSEFLAYLAFPLFALAGAKYFRSPRLCALLGLGLFFGTLSLALVLNNGQKFMLDFQYTSVRVLSEFIGGMLLYRFYRHLGPKLFAWPLIGLGLAGLLGHIFIIAPTLGAFYDWVGLLSFFPLILGASLVGSAKTAGPWEFLGKISYGLYLIHSLVIMGLNQIPFLGDSPYLSLSLFIFLSVFGGAFVYFWVERPCQKRLLGLFVGKWSYPANIKLLNLGGFRRF